ncbi:hypothetical protein B0A49_00504 [Cryomyces minteri]|uniref:Major facilitator superfamily (MFS) profile domain-containing protein n=1 Tax=Cryomyces minteri TaxID=331657 RepID=A0A4U0XVJ6_9PEZI|nr:hypothetical protein B0A49_00504 [Cryomyces minteri]
MSSHPRTSAGSSTSVIELQPITSNHENASKQSLPHIAHYVSRRQSHSKSVVDDRNESLPSPTTATEALQKWNTPSVNMYRSFAAFWGFIIMGANDAAYGAIIPYLESYYNLTYTVVSLIFLSPLVGYILSALLNNTIHLKLGQRGVAIIAPRNDRHAPFKSINFGTITEPERSYHAKLSAESRASCHLIAYVVIAVHPPYPVLVVIFMLAGFGNGLEDAAWNAWLGNMANANEILGFLHGFYGLGAVLSPLIATTMITKANLPWYSWYYIMIGAAGIELLTSVAAFWTATAAAFRTANPRTTDKQGNRMKEALATMPSARVTWLCAFFLLGYVGIEVALGGWIVTFMIRVRQGNPFSSGMTATGFWLGITVGRVILGFVTPRLGEKLAISIYLPLAMGLQLLFWLVPQFYVSAVAVSLVGFFLGPLFPAAVVASTKLLPRHLHVSAIGFAAAFGGSGAAIFPFAVGAIAQARGVQVLQPIVLALLAVVLLLWLGLPRIGRKSE